MITKRAFWLPLCLTVTPVFAEVLAQSTPVESNTGPMAVDITPVGNTKLNGAVYHWANHQVLPAAVIERFAAGLEQGDLQTTSASGKYEFGETAAGVVRLNASRAVQATDLNRTITSADALAALKIAVGLNPNSDPDGSGPLNPLVVSPYQLMAADMNGDGRVTSADALAILKVAVGLSDALAPSWALVPDDLPLWDTHITKSTVYKGATEYSVSYPDKTQVNFTAVLVGDVNASWSSDAESVDDAYFMALSARYQQAPELWHVRDTDADGLSDTQEGAIGTNAFSRDTDDDGIPDGQDIAPLDDTEGLDTDLDGIGNNADPDDDNDGIPDGLDLFPLDPLESADTDLDGIGDNRDFDIDGDGIPNEIDTDPFVSGRDSDGDGIVDSLDPMPNDPANFTDTDGDGVFDFYDADPTDPAISTTIEFDFSQVAAAGVSERIANTEQPPQGWLGKVKIKAFELFARLEYWLLGEEAMAQTAAAQLLSQTNLISWDASGDEVANAILSDDVLFVAEAVLTPKGDYLYLLTAPEIQRSLISQMGINAQPDRCQLYRVDLQTQGFECVLDDSAPTINPVVRAGTWRDDYLRSGITFRADGVAILETGQSEGPMVLYPNGEYQIFGATSREAPAGYFKIVENVVWLDDNHIGVSAMFPPNEGGATQTFWSAFNINTGEEVAEVEGDNFRIVVHDQTIYTAGEQFTWTGTEFAVTGGGSAIQDKFGNLWQKDSVYGLSITDQTRGLTLSLGDEGTSGPNIYMGSGTGTGIVYRDYDFAEDWVISKYSALARDTILTLEGEPYALREQMYIPLSDGRGALIKLTDPDLWYYLRNGNETGDVDIKYTVRTAAGSTEDRVYTIPFTAIQSFAAYDATIYDASSYANGYELLQENGEGVALELPNPEAEQSTFCVFQISTATQRCAELADYRVLKNDYENIRNNVERHFPADYYVCPDQECQAVPGVQNVVFGGKGLLAFFKDSTDNQYYKAEANIEDFMLRGDDALTITPVVNGAGESEIIALTANVKPSAQKYLAGVIATYDKGTITIDFAQPMSGLVAEPDVTMKLLDAETQIDLASIEWNADRTGLILQVQDKTQLEIAEYELDIRDWLFTNNSALRAVLAEPLLLNMTQALITEDIDTDGDGIGNKVDEDDDGDGVADTNDVFPLDATETVDFDGDGTGDNADTDDDNDGLEDGADAFPFDATEYLDTDGDGTGNNADTDDDNDTVEDANDAFPLDPAASVDTDNDGAPDDWNEGKSVQDSTTGLVLDTDDDNDGTLDDGDAFPLDASESRDTDLDGTGDNADTDDDNDGVEDANDAFPLDPAASVDTDADGLPDAWNEGYIEADSTTGLTLDLDANGNGVPDSEETGGNGGTGAPDDLILYYDGAVGADWDLGLCVYDIAAEQETCFGDAPSNDQGPVTWVTVDSGDATRGTALSLTFNPVDDAVFYIQSTDAVDISAFADGGVLSFDLKVSQGVYDDGFMFKADCFWPCTSNNITLVEPALTPGEWIRVEYPVADLETRGLVLEQVSNGVAVFPHTMFQQGKSFEIANIRYTANSTEALSRDFDGDGVLDRNDAFPRDPAASVDTDSDGSPDDWNEGYSIEDSNTGLNLDDDDDNDGVLDIDDAYPTDPNRSQNEPVGTDLDDDGTLDEQDAFPDDPAASVDTDQDGLPDDWNAGFTAADSTTGLSLDNDDDNDGILDADDLFATTADEGGYLADDLVASPYGVVRFIPGFGNDPIMLTGYEQAAWQLNADGTFVAHTDDPNQAVTGTWQAKANGYILSYSQSQPFGREFTSEQLRNIDRTVLATLVSDVSQPFELQVNEQWVVTLGIYLHGPLGWGVAYSTEQRVFATADGLAIDPSAPIFQSGGGIERNGVLPADKPTVPFTAEELAGSWLLEGLNSDAQDSDAQCNLGPCSDVLIVAADNTAQTLYSNRTATWQIDAAGALLLTFDDTAVEYTIERFDAGPEAQTVLVRFTQGDRLYAKMSMLIAQDQPVSGDLSAYYDQVLSSSYFVTAHPDRSGYRRDASDQLIDNFAFVLNSADGTGVQVAVNSERLSASGMTIQPGSASSQAITWTELNGNIEIERCYQFVTDDQGNEACALKQVRELQPVKLTAARLYVRENLTVVQDTDADGVFDFQHYVISRPNFYEITPYYDIDDFDRDGVANDLDAYPSDPDRSQTDNGTGTDIDADGVLDSEDAFPNDPAASVDTDQDGLPDDWNPGFGAVDSTTGLSLDMDDDGDGVLDTADVFPLDPFEFADFDLDGIGDNADRDDDNDFIPDGLDDFPFDPALGDDSRLRDLTAEPAEAELASIDGKVVDGYVSGAFVFLDLNFNGEHDTNEPSAVTDEFGDFNLKLDGGAAQCESLAPVVVDVPVGAIDSEQGEVLEAYQMIAPPLFASQYLDSTNLTLSPLTSVLWSEIKSALGLDKGVGYSCQALVGEISQQESIKDSLSQAITNIVRHYNLTEAQIYADFIAEGDGFAKQQALDIVKALKKSFAATAELRAMMPAASWASVTYYKFSALDGDDLYPNAWYRETNYKDGRLAVFEVVKVSDDLQTDVRLIIRGEREFSVEGDLQFQREREYESRGGDQSTYSCNDKESVSYTAAGVEYQLQNLASQSGITDSADCSFTTFAERTQGRYLFIRVFHDDGSENGAQFSFDIAENGFSGLENWVDFIGRGDQFAPAELQAYISQLPYQFCQTALAGATFVNRSRSVPGQDYNLVIDRANDGSYQIRTDYPDGRSVTETFAADAIACADYDIDLDGDGLANSVDDDIDGDGVANVDDLFPADPNDWADSDGDGVGDNADAFPNDPTEYRDSDGDGIGNNQDDDNDNDGILDVDDAFPLDARYSADTDRDGVADDIDNDSDNDNVPDNIDLFPTDPINAKDYDGDGIGDNTDTDDDNDGVEDAIDAFPFDATESADTDGDGVGDNTDVYPEDALESADTDGDGVGDNADAYPLDPNHYLAWADRNYLADSITRAQAATIRITSSTGVLISPKYAITAAHSPLDGNNEITPNLVAENAWGEKRAIVNVFYDVARDFAIVELESPYEKFGTVPIATERSETGSEAFIVGNPAYVVAMGLSRAVSFGTVTNYLEPDGFERFSDFHAFGGYSGSGVYNDQGELVGILSMAGCCDYSPYYDANLPTYNTTWDQYRQENIYAIPMEFIKDFLEQYQVQPELVVAPALPKNKLDPQKRPLLDADELARLDPIVATARQATVALWARPLFEVGNYSGSPNCTGALVAPTIVFTAAHCVEGRANFTVGFTGREIRYARVLETSPGGDVAILEMDEPAPEGYPMMAVATQPMQVGDIGLMVGHPRDQYYEFGGWIVSTIKAYTSDKGWASFWGHNGKGSSGGPLINEQGQIVGVLTAGSSGGDFPIGSYDNEYLYDIQDPHLQDTSPWPSPFTISFQSFAGNIEEHASLAYDYLTKEGVSRVLGAKAFDSAVYEWRETHTATGREGAIVRKDRDTLTPDANFGIAGVVTLPTQEGFGFVPRAVEQDASGRIWALVDTAYQANSTVSLAELDASGAVLQTQDWTGPYLKGRAVAIEGNTVFVGGEQMSANDRDVVLGRCDVSAADWVCTDLVAVEHDGQDYAAGLAVTPTHLVLGGFVDRHESAKNTDFAAWYVNKDTLEADLSVGDAGLVYLERDRKIDDSERVFGIQATSDGGVMLVGSEWVPFVSANLAVKLTPTGEVDTSFGEQGVFRTYNTPYHLKGLAQLNTVIETNDYYVFVGSQNFNGYIGWGLYNRNIDERKNVLGRDNDLTMVIANKDGTLADIPNPVVYWDGQAQEYLVSASERDGAIELLYREEFGNTLRRFVAPIMADKELNYLDPSITNTPVRFHNEGVERGSNQAEITCRKQDQQGTNLSIEFSYSSFSDKDDLVQVLDEYWLVNGQRLNQGNYLYGRRQDLDVGEYQYFMSYEDGRGNIEQIQTLPFNYQPERCLFRP